MESLREWTLQAQLKAAANERKRKANPSPAVVEDEDRPPKYTPDGKFNLEYIFQHRTRFDPDLVQANRERHEAPLHERFLRVDKLIDSRSLSPDEAERRKLEAFHLIHGSDRYFNTPEGPTTLTTELMKLVHKPL